MQVTVALPCAVQRLQLTMVAVFWGEEGDGGGWERSSSERRESTKYAGYHGDVRRDNESREDFVPRARRRFGGEDEGFIYQSELVAMADGTELG